MSNESETVHPTATLLTHQGARLVTSGELQDIEPPPPSGRWYPTAHSRVLDVSVHALQRSGFSIRETQLAVSPDNHKFFGTLQLDSELCPGVNLAVGIRNSTDKSFPIGFCCGEHVFVCDNLCFSSTIEVSRRHTKGGESSFITGVESAVMGLHGFQIFEAKQIQGFRGAVLEPDRADAIMLRAWRKEIVGTRLLPKLIDEWEKPSHEEFEERTAWSLLNCYTEVMKDRQHQRPYDAAAETMNFTRLLREETADVEQLAV